MGRCRPHHRLQYCRLDAQSGGKAGEDARMITNEIALLAKISFVFGMAFLVILYPTYCGTALRASAPVDLNRHPVNSRNARSAEHIRQIIRANYPLRNVCR